MEFLEFIRSHALALPPLGKFALGIALIFGIPPLARRIRLPAVVGLLLSGIVLGPHVFGIFGEQRPVADFFANLGKLLLMFVAGLEMDLARFRQTQSRSITFGLITASVPLMLGAAVGLSFGYEPIAAIVIGSLLASHTLLGSRVVVELGANRLEPFIVTVGATLLSDTLSLVVFAICVSTYESGFSISGLALQLMEIAVFVPIILVGLSRVGAYVLKKAEGEENAYFVFMFAIMAVAGVVARTINLPDISRRIPRRAGGQRRDAGQAGEREVGVLRQCLLHSDFLCSDGLPHRSARVCPQYNR
jgi:Kef-type K+ transport system membrane component KefB